MVALVLLTIFAQDTPITGDLSFQGDAGHVIQVQSDNNAVGRNLTIRAGHGLHGGSLDIMAGNSLLTGLAGSIGIGRVEGTARIITVGRLNDPAPTEQSFLRARQVFVDARELMSLHAPEVNIGAMSPLGGTAPGTVGLRLSVAWGSAFFAGMDHVDIGFNDTTMIQLYNGGLVLQKLAGGKLGFFDGVPVSRPVVSGSVSNGEAVVSLIKALAELNLIHNATTP